MKILVFTDVHGNLSALTALSKTDEFKTADKRIFLGDIVVGYSRPNECIELLSALDCKCLLGNNDSYVCDHIPEEELKAQPPHKILQMQYFEKNMSSENKDMIMSWEKDYTLNVLGKTFYFTHYPWETEDNVVESPEINTLESRQKMFEYIKSDYIIFGHEHMSNVFKDEKKLYYCLGSLGLRNPSPYLMIEVTEEDIRLEEKFVTNNLDLEIDLLKKAGYPYNKNKLKK